MTDTLPTVVKRPVDAGELAEMVRARKLHWVAKDRRWLRSLDGDPVVLTKKVKELLAPDDLDTPGKVGRLTRADRQWLLAQLEGIPFRRAPVGKVRKSSANGVVAVHVAQLLPRKDSQLTYDPELERRAYPAAEFAVEYGDADEISAHVNDPRNSGRQFALVWFKRFAD